MIGQLWGEVHELGESNVMLKVGGVGYFLVVSSNTLEKLKKGDEVCLHSHLHVREDILQLFGFYLKEERDLFLQLIEVSKVGPKVAMAILSGFRVDALKEAILNEDSASISRIPGIGKKTAERLVLELKDKIAPPLVRTGSAPGSLQLVGAKEAREALLALGYSAAEAQEALGMVDAKDLAGAAPEELVKQALKMLGKGRS